MKVGWWWLAASGVLVSMGVSAVVLGQLERRVTRTATQLLTLDYALAAGADQRTERVMRNRGLSWIVGPNANLRDQRMVAEYWRGQYSSVTAGDTELTSEANALLMAANAAYRAIKFDAAQSELIEQLQAVLNRYAEVMKRDSSNFDAAYNYQFVARTRDRIASAPRGAGSVPRPPIALDQTLHGRPGAQSPGLELNEFKVLSPHESEERREEQEAGKNAPRARKG